MARAPKRKASRRTPVKRRSAKSKSAATTERSSRSAVKRRGTAVEGDAIPMVSGSETGRFIVLFSDDGETQGINSLKSAAGLSTVCSTADFECAAVDMKQADDAEIFVLDNLKVAVVTADPTQAVGMMSAAADQSSIIAVEPERIMHTLSMNPSSLEMSASSLEYVRGYRDAVNSLYAAISREEPALAEVGVAEGFVDTALATWGLQATRVSQSRFSGKGIRIAVLDTGMDFSHPDFENRPIESKSFISGENVQDGNGHGTHCIGTSVGPRSPATSVRRYGCAFEAEVFAGKVLSNGGSGADRGILAGINWAITNGCNIVSMSLGASVRPGESFSRVYETVAQRALNANPGTLIIAASGNSSRRPGTNRRKEPPNPVGRPANCPSIMAVAAVDADLDIAPFSDGAINPDGGNVDIAGPGVNVFSSFPENRGVHASLSGTSMATPHVAGIAAMWLEAQPGTSAKSLWRLITDNAQRLQIPSRDVGAGLARAPV